MANITHIFMKKEGKGLLQGAPTNFAFRYHDSSRDTIAQFTHVALNIGDYNDDPLSDPSVDDIRYLIQISTSPTFPEYPTPTLETGMTPFVNGALRYASVDYYAPSGIKYVRLVLRDNQGKIGYSNVITMNTAAMTRSFDYPPIKVDSYIGLDPGYNYAGSLQSFWGFDNPKLEFLDRPLFISTETAAVRAPQIEWSYSGTGRIIDWNNTGLEHRLLFHSPSGALISSSPWTSIIESPKAPLPVNVQIGKIQVQIQQTYGAYFRYPRYWTVQNEIENNNGLTDPTRITYGGMPRFFLGSV